jgi:hypothetical protein
LEALTTEVADQGVERSDRGLDRLDDAVSLLLTAIEHVCAVKGPRVVECRLIHDRLDGEINVVQAAGAHLRADDEARHEHQKRAQ